MIFWAAKLLPFPARPPKQPTLALRGPGTPLWPRAAAGVLVSTPASPKGPAGPPC